MYSSVHVRVYCSIYGRTRLTRKDRPNISSYPSSNVLGNSSGDRGKNGLYVDYTIF